VQHFPDDDSKAVDIGAFSRRLSGEYFRGQPVVDGVAVRVIKHAAIRPSDAASTTTQTPPLMID